MSTVAAITFIKRKLTDPVVGGGLPSDYELHAMGEELARHGLKGIEMAHHFPNVVEDLRDHLMDRFELELSWLNSEEGKRIMFMDSDDEFVFEEENYEEYDEEEDEEDYVSEEGEANGQGYDEEADYAG